MYPTDQYGQQILQLVAFDTRTGEQLYRTPDEEPDDDADLGGLYPETMPLLEGLSNERAYFEDTAIDLVDGSTVPASEDADGIDVYEGYAETLFADGYHVGLREVGGRFRLVDSRMYGLGRLTPARSTIFDLSMWPTEAVVYDATTGRRRPIDAPGSTSSWSGGATRTRSSASRSTTTTGCAPGRSSPASCGPSRARR